MYRSVILAIGLAHPLTAQRAVRPSPPAAIAFVDVGVIPMDRERLLTHQTVVFVATAS